MPLVPMLLPCSVRGNNVDYISHWEPDGKVWLELCFFLLLVVASCLRRQPSAEFVCVGSLSQQRIVLLTEARWRSAWSVYILV